MNFDLNANNIIKAKEPTMDHVNNKAYIGFIYPKTQKQINYEIQQNYKEGNKHIKPKKYINGIITLNNKKQFVVYSQNEQQYQNLNLRYELNLRDQTISINTIKKVIRKEKIEIDEKQIFEDIKKEIKKYCYLQRKEEYDIITIYLMLTYKYLFLDFMPIIHLNGDAGTGKSQVGKICSKIGFNATSSVSASKSSFFRRVDRKRGLYFMDEKEHLEEYEKELLNGCVYEGNIHTITEKHGDEFIDTDFHIYTPVILACINDIYGATSTRTIKIETSKPPRKNKKYPVIKLTEDQEIWQDIRDKLVLWSIKTYNENKELLLSDEEMESIISNRAIDTWKCILNQSKKLGCYEDIKNYVTGYYFEQLEDNKEYDVNFKFIKYLSEMNNEEWIESRELYNDFIRMITEDQLKYFTKTRFGIIMRKLGYLQQIGNKKRTSKGIQYLLNKTLAKTYLENNYEYVEKIEEDQELKEERIKEGV